MTLYGIDVASYQAGLNLAEVKAAQGCRRVHRLAADRWSHRHRSRRSDRYGAQGSQYLRHQVPEHQRLIEHRRTPGRLSLCHLRFSVTPAVSKTSRTDSKNEDCPRWTSFR